MGRWQGGPGVAPVAFGLLIICCEPTCRSSASALRGVRPTSHANQSPRQRRVQAAFLHGWRGYRQSCWGHDELQPVSRNCSDELGGLGAQIIDALDTLLLMGLQEEYQQAVAWVAANFTAAQDAKVSVFETTIRILGGLLSAHFMSGDSELLRLAHDVGCRLLPAWREGPIPHELVNLLTGQVGEREPGLGSSLAEIGTLQLEFTALTVATGDDRFRIRGEHVMDLLGSLLQESRGLLPIMLRAAPPLGWTNSRVTLGGRGDSFYEYLLKQWLIGNRTEERYRKLYRLSVKAIRSALVGKSWPSNTSFVREVDSLTELEKWLPPLGTTGSLNFSSWVPLEDVRNHDSSPLTFAIQVVEARDTAGANPLSGKVEGLNAALQQHFRGAAAKKLSGGDGGGGQGSSEVKATDSTTELEEEEEEEELEDEEDEAEVEAAGACNVEEDSTLELEVTGTRTEKEDAVSEMEISSGDAVAGDAVIEEQDKQQGTATPEMPWAQSAEEEVEEPETCQVAPANGGMKTLAEIMQAFFGNSGYKQVPIFINVPSMPAGSVCAIAELLRSGRWDLLHSRGITIGTPEGFTLRAELLDHISGMLGKQVGGQCANLGLYKMDHLACFLPGVLALGVLTGTAEDSEAELQLAGELVQGCARMWLSSPLGLAPESAAWNVLPGREQELQVINEAAYSILRPETVESLWYLYLATGNSTYQQLGWKIFTAIEKHARIRDGGYSGVEDVRDSASPRRRDRMETFLLSETFKYLFLLFAEGAPPIDLQKVVLNTEGHPLPVVDLRGGHRTNRHSHSRA